MKKSLLFAALLLSFCVAFVSCSKDDDPEVPENYVYYAGDYYAITQCIASTGDITFLGGNLTRDASLGYYGTGFVWSIEGDDIMNGKHTEDLSLIYIKQAQGVVGGILSTSESGDFNNDLTDATLTVSQSGSDYIIDLEGKLPDKSTVKVHYDGPVVK
jgi:hypothetical protein